MRRKYSDNDRLKAAMTRAAKPRDEISYPMPRQPGEIIQRQNGQEITVTLYPWGRCDQWRAVFPDGSEIKGGMAEIHAEIRRRMPPVKGMR